MMTKVNVDLDLSSVSLLLCCTCILVHPPWLAVEAHFAKTPSLLIISFDGFRWDYIDRVATPNFHRVMKEGVHARKGMKNVFVSNTLPNHWSMVTGLYPESHGVIDNHILDPTINKTFIPKYIDPLYQNDPRYYDAGGEPIWVTNQLKTKHGRSGNVMWWGGENAVKWIRPTLHEAYDDQVPFESRIDTVVKWFTSENPINLGLVYFEEPDHIAHKCGPESVNVTNKISYLDGIVGYLLKELEDRDLLDDINVIFTSDHGFTNTSRSKLIYLDDIIDPNDYKIITYTPLASIFPNKGKEEQLYRKLKTASEGLESHFKVYRRQDIPDRFHYKRNSRTPPIVALAELQFSFITNMSIENFTLAGTHGYDNEYQQMHPFFMAMGPSFKENFAVETFSNVDLYPLMCQLLHITPAPNNGSMAIVSEFLHNGHENTMWTFGTYIFVLIVIASVGGVFSVAACRQNRFMKRKRLQLRLSPLQATIKYSTPPRGEAKTRLLSDDDEDEDEFDDAPLDASDNILEVVSKR